jgi:flavin-dependent dehydrogenase
MGRDDQDELFEQTTWQVRRSDFDAMMINEAVARGASLVHGTVTRPLLTDDGAVRGLEVRLEDGGVMEIESEVVLDCSGLHTFLAKAGVTGPKYRGHYDRQIANFTHVAGALRQDAGPAGTGPEHDGNTLIFYKGKYHWAWFIPIDDEVTSVGIVTPSAYYLDKKEARKDFIAREIRELNPELSWRVPEINMVEEARSIVNYSYQVRQWAGRGYICIGDAHRFVDPIFSFGLYVSLREAEFAADAVRDYLNGKDRDAANPFLDHMVMCDKGIDEIEDMVDTFWEQPFAFATFTHQRYIAQIIDIFAGRVYSGEESQVLGSMRRLLGRDRSVDDGISQPIGSRYHPERYLIWQNDSPARDAF